MYKTRVMRRRPYMYRYVAFIYPPKSMDPVSYASPHISVLVLFLFLFVFVFVLHGKIETATTNHFFEACTGQAVVGECMYVDYWK